MSESLLERLRASVELPQALKIALSYLRSSADGEVIFVFEGPEDVGVYETWIDRLGFERTYKPLVASNKAQLLSCRRFLASDRTGLKNGVLFFIDRDFDDNRGEPSGSDLFSTDRYSVENYLVCTETISSVLYDEMRCVGSDADHQAGIAAFEKCFDELCQIMRPVNRRIFRAVRLAIKVIKKEERISRYASIRAGSVEARQGVDIAELIVLAREPDANDCANIDQEFDMLVPKERHRGKYFWAFLLKWLDTIADDRRSNTPAVFKTSNDRINFASSALTKRSMASRSLVPDGLYEFLHASGLLRPVIYG